MSFKTETTSNAATLSAGQRLRCAKCGSEIEIINPCTCNPPDQVLKCCGQEMTPVTSGNDDPGSD